MSSKVKIKKISYENMTLNSFNSNSFERFGDNLCELII